MKSNYEKALGILKNRISTLALNHKIGNRDIANSEIKDIVKAIETHVTPIFEQVLTELEQAQKQEKLLELYREINDKSKKLISLGRNNIWSWILDFEIIEIDQQIKELENE